LYIPLIENCLILGGKVIKRIDAYKRYLRRRIGKWHKKIWLFVISVFNFMLAITFAITNMLSAMFLFAIFFGIINSLNTYFVSENLTNIKNVELILKKQYELGSEDYSIKYFNDSYIFVEHISISEEEQKKLKEQKKDIPKEIIILKFDSFFSNEQKH
jgi:hypothetical protein